MGPAVLACVNHRGVRLDISLVNRLRRELALNNHIRFGETDLQIATVHRHSLCDVSTTVVSLV